MCLTLSDLMDCRLPGSSVNGICQARVLEWGAIAFSKAINKSSLMTYFLDVRISGPDLRNTFGVSAVFKSNEPVSEVPQK